MFCTKCGKEIEESDLFCPNCGAKQGETVRKMILGTREETKLLPEEEEALATLKSIEEEEEAEHIEKERDNNGGTKRKKKIFTFKNILVAVVFIVVGLYTLGDSKEEYDQPQSPKIMETIDGDTVIRGEIRETEGTPVVCGVDFTYANSNITISKDTETVTELLVGISPVAVDAEGEILADNIGVAVMQGEDELAIDSTLGNVAAIQKTFNEEIVNGEEISPCALQFAVNSDEPVIVMICDINDTNNYYAMKFQF